jgi:hypothetical protein
VDVFAPPSALINIWEAALAGALNFSIESDGKIAFDAPQGSVASKSDLLILRAVTVVDRGSDGEKEDFRWLLAEVARKCQILPRLEEEELEYVRRSGEPCLGRLDCLLLGAVLSANNFLLGLNFILN